MTKIKNKILAILRKFLPDTEDGLSLLFIKEQAVLFIFCILLYLIMTIFDWVRLGYPDKQEFRNFLVVLGGFSTIITMYGKWLVDKDKNGIPDIAEEKINTTTRYTQKENTEWNQKSSLK